MIDRLTYYTRARFRPFGGVLTDDQFHGQQAVLDEWERHPGLLTDERWLAYALATAFHETGRTMAGSEENLVYSADGLRREWPLRFTLAEAKAYSYHSEQIANRAYAGRNGNGDEASGDGWKYRGRGLVHLTGKANYQKASMLVGHDLTLFPDLALRLDIAAAVLLLGLVGGIFTGRKFEHFFNGKTNDPRNARRMVNGLDNAASIAVYHRTFLTALTPAVQKGA